MIFHSVKFHAGHSENFILAARRMRGSHSFEVAVVVVIQSTETQPKQESSTERTLRDF